jgi:cyclopropane fatty-acyl-phospholipid synthase-like methyltransferase
MLKTSEIYSNKWFKERHTKPLLDERVKPFCEGICHILGKPNTLIEVGCGHGDILTGFLNMDIDAHGLEGSEAAIPYIRKRAGDVKIFIEDLRFPLKIEPKYDLVTCVEVAEHLEEEYADQFVINLVHLSSKILITAAVPGQKGYHHINCQPSEYWHKKFEAHGYIYNKVTTESIKSKIKELAGRNLKKYHLKHVCDNMLFYEEKGD